MQFFYSASANAFFPDGLRADYERSGTWPSDAVAVPDALYMQFGCGEVPHGKIRVSGSDGMPMWGDVPPLTPEQALVAASTKLSSLMAHATAAIAPLQDASDLGIATDAELQALTTWKRYRVALSRLPSQKGFPLDVDWPEQPK
ncbi:tail fiber assembly protein [Achromobacter sp. DH1f]|uniref:tail fiber assembly protein n=1 Tax=Achromobacter sp. DH1f TaxID=1397275 RepID=UPI00046AA22F|nr:tail fiber assembly protein [Achromobacter sp. DH1f]